MRNISSIRLYQILDSRGFPTIEVEIVDNHNNKFNACAPSGASTGEREVIELRDKRPNYFCGKSVENLLEKKEILKTLLVGQPLNDSNKLDEILLNYDSTKQKKILGGNLFTALTFCFLKACSGQIDVYNYLGKKNKIPRPFVNIINGGKHAGNKLKIQEFMIVPSEGSIDNMINNICSVYHNLKKIIARSYGAEQTSIGDEGGYAPNINSPEEALDLIMNAIKTSGLEPGKDMFLALDCAASEFYLGKYEIEPDRFMGPDELIEYYKNLCQKYPIISIEDPFDENDFDAWIKFTEVMGDKIMIVGDDLFTTNPEYVKRGIENKWANSLLVKVNQIGTYKEAKEAMDMIKQNNGMNILSHRSGETNDDIIVDIAVGYGADFLKIGAPCRGERISKYNRLWRIYNP